MSLSALRNPSGSYSSRPHVAPLRQEPSWLSQQRARIASPKWIQADADGEIQMLEAPRRVFSYPKRVVGPSTLLRSLGPNEGIQIAPGFVRTPDLSTRERVGRACDKCRSRKTKCSGGKPECSRCVDRGIKCTYGETPAREPISKALRQREALRAEELASFEPPMETAPRVEPARTTPALFPACVPAVQLGIPAHLKIFANLPTLFCPTMASIKAEKSAFLKKRGQEALGKRRPGCVPSTKRRRSSYTPVHHPPGWDAYREWDLPGSTHEFVLPSVLPPAAKRCRPAGNEPDSYVPWPVAEPISVDADGDVDMSSETDRLQAYLDSVAQQMDIPNPEEDEPVDLGDNWFDEAWATMNHNEAVISFAPSHPIDETYEQALANSAVAFRASSDSSSSSSGTFLPATPPEAQETTNDDAFIHQILADASENAEQLSNEEVMSMFNDLFQDQSETSCAFPVMDFSSGQVETFSKDACAPNVDDFLEELFNEDIFNTSFPVNDLVF